MTKRGLSLDGAVPKEANTFFFSLLCEQHTVIISKQVKLKCFLRSMWSYFNDNLKVGFSTFLSMK